ncbi:solute carrier family 35 member F6 [Planococcus citri]|uniref:solute carrier family 35 member F6 n=1 Tax=Planococcus citri TaxID=170843 RepID=UPI0031F8A22D
MAFTRYQVLLIVVMVATGSINTLSTKWADRLFSVGSDGGAPRKFDHPFVQSCFMFLGEILCLIAFKTMFRYYTSRQVIVEDVDLIRGSQNFNPFLFFPPAMFDMVATSIMYVGLELTYSSSFQMLRGSVIVFVALLSSSFVGRETKAHQWYGIVIIIAGLSVVGLADVSSSKGSKDSNSIITGDLLVIMAQIITACQMVYEEKYVVDKDIPPLQAVGWEGTFGFVVLSILLIPFYFIKVGPPFAENAHGVLEDFPDAITQIYNNGWLLVSCVGTMISIAFFNFAGISMTKEVSATSRMIIDTVRTFFIWIACLILGWEQFHSLQLLGFSILLFGMCFYYKIIPFAAYIHAIRGRTIVTEEPIINQRVDEP